MEQQDMDAQSLTLVLGGTGKIGRRVAERLSRRGVPTRVASRSSRPAFDWAEPATWDAVLDGVSAIYLSYAPDLAIPGATDSIHSFTRLAVKKGVERLVLLSGRGEVEAQHCEHIVQRAGVEWTVVRASWFNQNFSEGEFLGMVMDGTIAMPAGDVPEPFVDADDIADVAVAALAEPGHVGEVYEVTGPRTLTLAEVASEISIACGREIAYLPVPHQAFVNEAEKSGAPKEIVWLLDYLFSTVLDGRNAYVADGVQRALGRAPRDFADFARAVAAMGAWRAAA